MKVPIEIDLSLLDDEGKLEEHMVGHIVDKLLKAQTIHPPRKASRDMFATAEESPLERQVHKVFDAAVLKRINKLVDDEFKMFVTRKFSVTDKWGSPQRETSLRQELRSRFDDFVGDIDKAVGNKGTVDVISRLLDKDAKKLIDQFHKTVSNQVVAAIKEQINDDAAKRVTEAILSDFKLKDLIK